MISARALIQAYTEAANKLLPDLNPSDPEADRRAKVQAVYDAILPTCEGDEDLIAQLDHIHQDFTRALFPIHFFNRRVRAWDSWFNQSYALMEQIFEPDVLDEADVYRDAFPDPIDPKNPPTFAMVSRFWRVSGDQRYDASGRLTRFAFDPLVATEEIAATSSGTYMSLAPARPGEAIGAIGYAATRNALRGKGHGQSAVQDFERAMIEAAAQRGETLKLLMLEAETTATVFWTRCGYRWPDGAKYMQPPISFDPATGEPNFPPKLEILMVKAPDAPNATHIDKGILLEALRTMLGTWFRPQGGTPEALKRVDEHLFGKYYREFEDSIAHHGQNIPLIAPPSFDTPAEAGAVVEVK
ncbi:MAG: hypothetical protein SF162_17020 [bacterium]|nr:hypothetical protein [bacterium]